MVGVDATGQSVSSGQTEQVIESAAVDGLNTATGASLTGADTIESGVDQQNSQGPSGDAEVQISSELVDNQSPSALSSSGIIIVR